MFPRNSDGCLSLHARQYVRIDVQGRRDTCVAYTSTSKELFVSVSGRNRELRMGLVGTRAGQAVDSGDYEIMYSEVFPGVDLK